MISKNKARKIFKKLREKKSIEFRKKEFDKINKSSYQENSEDFKNRDFTEFNEQSKLIGNDDLKLDSINDAEVNANLDLNEFKDLQDDEESSTDIDSSASKNPKEVKELEANYKEPKNPKELEVNSSASKNSKDVKELEVNSKEPKDVKEFEANSNTFKDSKEPKDVKELEVNSSISKNPKEVKELEANSNISKDVKDETDENEILKNFQKSNEEGFSKQNKLIGNIDTKLDKFEQKLFHSQGGSKTALQKDGDVLKLESATTSIKNKALQIGKDNPQIAENMSNGAGFLAAGLASLGFNAIGSGYNFIKEKMFSNENNENSINGEVIQNTNELSPKDIEKMEAEELKEQTKEKASEKSNSNTQYLKKKEKSLLSYLPFFKEKEEYKLSDQVHNMLKTDGNLKEKESILNEVKKRNDVDKTEIKKLEEHVIKQREIEKQKEEARKSAVTMNIDMSHNDLMEKMPEYADEFKKLKNEPRYKKVSYWPAPRGDDEELDELWWEYDRAKRDLFKKYAKKYAATVDPTIIDARNYKGEKLSPEEYAPEYFQKEIKEVAEKAKATVKNSSESVAGVEKPSTSAPSSGSNTSASVDNNATSPASVSTNSQINKESPTSVESSTKQSSNSTATPAEPQKDVKEGKVLPANVSGSDTVSQGEATAADNSSSESSQEASTAKSPSVSATSSNAYPSVPASVSTNTNSTNNVELSGASKQLAKDTVGTEPKPDTITNESVVNNQVIEKVPESPWDKFNNAELTKSQDEFLRGK